MSNLSRTAVLLLLAVGLSACERRPPPCPYNDAPGSAPSAGCFVATEAGLLVVEQPGGTISVPGGMVEPGESARCAAVRETWEETGLRVSAGRLLSVFDSGFELYACDRQDENAPVRTRMPGEVSAVYFLPYSQFREARWRFSSDLPIIEQIFYDTD